MTAISWLRSHLNLDLTREIDLGLSNPLNLAGGLEWRRDTYGLHAGELASYYVGTGTLGGGIQSFFGYSPTNASNNSRTDFSQYLDVSIKPTEKWLVDGAVPRTLFGLWRHHRLQADQPL
jgi:iron complex outermembrane receptor protein